MTKSQDPMTNRKNNTDKSDKRIYDLEERTARFGENIIEFSKKIPQNPVTISLINQVVRAATSVGANYCEADNAISKKDFYYRINICRKESKETKYWLRMIIKAVSKMAKEATVYKQEAQELNAIFSSIGRGRTG